MSEDDQGMPAGGSYRERIYARYSSGRMGTVAPRNLSGLSPRAPYLRRVISEHFPVDRHSPILDLGCGHGALIHFARQAGYDQIRGVDAAPEQVEAARALGVEGVEQGDLMEYLSHQADSCLAVVVAFDVLEHFHRDELLPFVDEVFRVLAPGGRWLIHVPNGGSPFGAAVRYGDLTHELAFTQESLGQLLLTSRFSGVQCYEDAPVVHGAKSAIRWGLWKVIRGLLWLYEAVETGSTGSECIFSRNLLAVAQK